MTSKNGALTALKWITVAALIIGLVLLLWGTYLMGMSIFPSYVAMGTVMVAIGASLDGIGTIALFSWLAAAAVIRELKGR